MFSEAENVMDCFSAYYLLAIVPLVFVIASPAEAVASNYLVYRVHQIDLYDSQFGSRGASINFEAVTPEQISTTFARKCALFKLKDVVNKNYQVFVDKVLDKSLVSGVLIIFTNSSFFDLKGQELINLKTIEKKLLTSDTSLPIYLVQENELINDLYDQFALGQGIKQTNPYDLFIKNVFFDSHQFVVSDSRTSPISDPQITSFQTKFVGSGVEDKLPTYVIVAHYDSYSFVPSLSYGADSNASGLVVLLELMRIISKLYADIKTKPKANIVFFVSGGGKLNYYGTKNWLNENVDSNNLPTSSLLANMNFAICLDSLADSQNTNGLFMYVSKPPKADSSAANFWNNIVELVNSHYHSINATQIHKKINLAENHLSWEHERFSLRKMSAFTLSSVPSSEALLRRSIVDVHRPDHVNVLEAYTNIIGEALMKQLYTNVNQNSLVADYQVSKEHLRSLFEHFATSARSQQLLLTTGKGPSFSMPSVLNSIHVLMKKYSNNQVTLVHSKTSSKKPDFVLYQPISSTLDIFNMKPAVFHLFIIASILFYLFSYYLVVKYFHHFGNFVKSSAIRQFIAQFDNQKLKTK